MFVEFLSNPSVRGQGWTANYTSTITTGIDEELLKANFNFYPNPTVGIFMVNSGFESSATIEIIDLLGKKVLKTFQITKGSNQIDASSLSSGIYLIKLKIGDGYHIERLVIN